MTNIDTLKKEAENLNIKLDERSEEMFLSYKELLKEWNQKINITAITEDVEIDQRHFLDSLTVLGTGLFQGEKKVIDVGTGGGFPGLPIKIVNDELDVTLFDSLNKRIKFLDIVIEELGLDGIRAVHGRAEESARTDEYREEYDICVSRAVAQLNTLAEYCLPFVKVGGYFISMKGSDVQEEVNEAKNAIKTLGGELEEIQEVQIPGTDIVHSLVIIKKVGNTAKTYPRGGGNPRKNPL